MRVNIAVIGMPDAPVMRGQIDLDTLPEPADEIKLPAPELPRGHLRFYVAEISDREPCLFLKINENGFNWNEVAQHCSLRLPKN